LKQSIFEASEALQKWEEMILKKKSSFHWLLCNSEEVTTWISLIDWPLRTSTVYLIMNSSQMNSFIVLWLKLNFNFNEHSYLIISFTLDLPWRENYAPLSLFSWSHIQSEEKITSSPYFRNTKNKILHMAANTVHNVKIFLKENIYFWFFLVFKRILFMPKWRFKQKLFTYIFCFVV
jgi:hypothetical protein